MADLYEEWAAEAVSDANWPGIDERTRDAYGEMASELLSLANQADG